MKYFLRCRHKHYTVSGAGVMVGPFSSYDEALKNRTDQHETAIIAIDPEEPYRYHNDIDPISRIIQSPR